MAKAHIKRDWGWDRPGGELAYCGRIGRTAMTLEQYAGIIDNDGDKPDDACARCVDIATDDLTRKREYAAAREMDAAREAVEGALYAWQDAANASDTPKARKAQAMAAAMLAILDAGMLNGGSRAF